MKQSSLKYAKKWIRYGLSVAVLASACGYAVPAMAQQNQNFNKANNATAAEPEVQAIDGGSSGQQLPSGFANDQVPPSFAQDSDQPTTPVSDQIIPAKSTDTKTTTVKKETTTIVKEEAADAPAQPEVQKLVKSTPMGAAAQAVGANKAAKANPVEDAADAADAAQTAESDTASEQDVLEKYSNAAQDTGADGDALPAVNTVNMVKLKGDFPNSNRNVNVAVDGAVDGKPDSEDQKKLQESIREEAFDAAITGMFPLSPEQIKTLLGKYDKTQRAVGEPPFDAPKPEVTVQNISLDPGVMPPTIKTAVGNVTTMNILDATGAPWPVQDVTWAGDFEIVEPEEGGHIIRITPMAQFARGNMVIRLLTLKTPITLTLETSRDVVQYRVDARVPEYGPFASAPLMSGGKSLVAGDSTLTGLLDGVAPTGAAKMEVAGVDGRTTAYNMGGSTYVRTPLTLLSPAWQSSVSSADGMNVYVLSSAPVLLLSV